MGNVDLSGGESSELSESQFSWLDDESREFVDASSDFLDACCALWRMDDTGEPELVIDAVARYLRGRLEPDAVIAGAVPEPPPASLRTEMALACHLSDKAYFVDAGVSLRCAWRTERGTAWLQDYDLWRGRSGESR